MLRCVRMLWRSVWPDLLPLAALTAVVVFAVGHYISDRFQGGGDSLWYYGLLTDVLHQVRAGTFPVYVGQTNASWNGYPAALLPGFLLSGLAIDTVTFGRLSVVEVMQLVGVWSLWAGALTCYFCLKTFIPAYRWLAAAMASVYVCCPALLSLLTAGDMYPALSTTPYYPLLLYGLIRGARRADAVGVAFVGGALAALWMCHAGVALWCSTGTALFLAGHAVLSGHFWRTSRFSVCAATLFLVLGCWYFGTVFALGIHRNHTFNHHHQKDAPVFVTGGYYADVVASVVEKSVPKTYLPLPTDFDAHAVQQLGYSVLALLGFAALVATRVRSLELRLLVAGAAILFVSTVPIPQFTKAFWGNLPRPFLITETWPMTRFGILISGATVFAVALATERLLPPGGGRLLVALRPTAPDATLARRRVLPLRAVLAVLAVAGAVGVGYSLREIGTIHAWVPPNRAVQPQAALLTRPENQPLSVFNWVTFRDPRFEGRDNVKDLYLYDRVLSNDGGVLASNLEAAQRGATEPFTVEGNPAEAVTPDGGLRPVAKFRIEPRRHYLLTLHTEPQNADCWFHVAGGTLWHVHRVPFNGLRPQDAVIPVWTTADEPQVVRVSVAVVKRVGPEPAAVRVEVKSLIGFDPEALPVKVKSLMPYTVAVRTDGPSHLETHRQFVPGYEAWVNGERVELTRSPDGMLLVPLAAGENEVKLVYRGPLLARVGFVVSAIGWLGLLSFTIWRVGRLRPLSIDRPHDLR